MTTLPTTTSDYQYKAGAPAPFDHQVAGFEATRDKEAYGIFWEQRCGKSRVVIDTAAYLYQQGKIDALFLVAPSGVQLNWILDEIPAWLPESVAAEAKMHCYNTAKAATAAHQAALKELLVHKGFAVLAMSFSSFMTKPSEKERKARIKKGKDVAWAFLKKRRCLYVVDEAHHIKTPGKKRTISIIASGVYAHYRRVLTGTPASEGPFDTYAPVRFLDHAFWARRGMSQFSSFRTHFGVFLTPEQLLDQKGYIPMVKNKKGKMVAYPVFAGYRNIPELNRHLATISHRVTQDQVLKLPPALYQKRYFEMTPRQARLYDTLKTEYEIEIEKGVFISAALAIVRHGRLQQIASGYVPDDSGEPRSTIEPDREDPRMELLKETLEDITGQVVIFCQYRLDVSRIMAFLGEEAVRYDGSITDEEGAANRIAFREGKARYIVVTFSKGSEGLNFATAQTVVIYSHTIKSVQRSQAEERIKAPNQTHHCTYVDLIGRNTVDELIIKALRDKRDVSAAITGDTLREWI